MNKVDIHEIIGGLCRIPDKNFTCNNIAEVLSKSPVEVDSIRKYFYWSEKFYTRNLVYKDERLEVIVLCWESGQFSPVHNHSDQKCWMTVPVGKLHGQNFRVVDFDEGKKFCKLEKTGFFDLSDGLVNAVDLEEPIHQILNLPESNERAVSVHIYSRPFDRCLAYCLETHTFREVNLRYTSVGGILSEDITL